MTLKQKYGSTALVAGTSEGIGAAFAEYLAAEGMDLVLVARHIERLQHFADFLQNKYTVMTMCLSCDLAEPNSSQEILEALNGKEINLIVYNAAQSYIGPFIKNSVQNHSRMVLSISKSLAINLK